MKGAREAIWALVLVGLAGCGYALPTNADDAGPGVDATSPDAGWARTGTVTLGIATWNIEQFPKTATTTTAVPEILAELGADIIGIEEILEPGPFERMVADLPDWEAIRVEEPYDYLAVGILYRPARIRILEAEPIFTGEAYAFPRPPLWARVEALDGAGHVVFDFELLVVHLKAQGDPQSQDRRRVACEELERWIRERQAAGGEQDIIIVGDWNDRIDDLAAKNVFRPFLEAPERYTFLSQELVDAGESSYILIPGVIDHILVTHDALDEYGPGHTEPVMLDQTYPDYVRNVSDHRPVRATFVIR